MKGAELKKKLSKDESRTLLDALQSRFEKHPHRHEGIAWSEVASRITSNPGALRSLHEMEESGGEPDVVSRDPETGEIQFVDCASETPKGRVSVCYDRAGLESRKEHSPKTSAIDMAAEMGVELLTPEQYRELQTLGEFDVKTSSWVKTPADIRERGGALFGDRRFGHVFIYHNGAQSYYAARGFRASLKV
jgi:hypothetical protein